MSKLSIIIIFMTLVTINGQSQSTELNNPIARIWRGWTTFEKADQFESLLISEAIPSIEKNKPKGCQGIQLLKRVLENEVEFTTIMWFDSIESVKSFAGDDYTNAHIDPSVRPLLLRYDSESAHHVVQLNSN